MHVFNGKELRSQHPLLRASGLTAQAPAQAVIGKAASWFCEVPLSERLMRRSGS
jgi:hypothetical protein